MRITRIATPFAVAVGIAVSILPAVSAVAGDNWPQWGGPNRDFTFESATPPTWPEGGFKWRRALGEGYSGVVGEEGRLYTMFRRGEREVVVALSAADGETVWEHAYDAPLPKDAVLDFGRGPNATPLLAGGRLVTVGFNGLLKCFDTRDGKVLWSIDLLRDLSGSKLEYGYSACPLLYRDTVIVPVGGKDSAIVALKLSDGSKVWSAQTLTNTYSTPILIHVDGQEQLVLVMSDQVVGVEPSGGDLLWSFPFTNQWHTHVVVPVWCKDNLLFVASFQQAFGLRLRQSGGKTELKEVWSNKKLGISHSNAVRIGDVVYCSSGSSRASFVTAVNVNTGAVLWKERGFGMANFIALGDHLLILDAKGKLALARPTEAELNVLDGQRDLLEAKAWTAPTLMGDTLFARDQKHIVAVRLR